MNEQELIELFKKTFPFWDSMNQRDKETFIRSSYKVSFPAGTNIHDGNECTGVILIKSGSLRLYLLSEEGKTYRQVTGARSKEAILALLD